MGIKKFAEMIGFAPQVISNIVSGRRSKPSFDILNAILSSFVDVNSEWLITGKGEMLKENKNISVGNKGNNNTNIINSPNSNNQQYTENDILILQKENEMQRNYIEQLKKILIYWRNY